MRILIADAHSIVRRGLRQLIADAIRPKEVCETDSGAAALAELKARSWHLLVLDLSLPDMDGLDVLKSVRTLRPDQKTLVFSLLSEQHYAVRALKAGAHGYISKSRPAPEIVQAMRRVLDGHTYVSTALAEQLARQAGRGGRSGVEVSLSDREIQVVRLLGQGRSVTQIADRLGLSVKTVSTHRANLLRKLGLQTTGDLIRYAIEQDLTS